MSWFVTARRTDLEHPSSGMDDGGCNISGPLFPGQTQLFTGKGKKNVHKKRKPNRAERNGEPNPQTMRQM